MKTALRAVVMFAALCALPTVSVCATAFEDLRSRILLATGAAIIAAVAVTKLISRDAELSRSTFRPPRPEFVALDARDLEVLTNRS